MSLFSTPTFLFTLFIFGVVGVGIFYYIVAASKLEVSAYLPPEDGKRRREEARKVFTRVTLALLLILEVFVFFNLLDGDMRLQNLRVRSEQSTWSTLCTPAVHVGGSYVPLEPCGRKEVLTSPSFSSTK